MTDLALQRSSDVALVARRLDSRRVRTTTSEIERAYDAALADLSHRLRIVHRPGLPLMRSPFPWIVQKRSWLRWRLQGPFGMRRGFPTREHAEGFLAVCLHVDARDEAFEALCAS